MDFPSRQPDNRPIEAAALESAWRALQNVAPDLPSATIIFDRTGPATVPGTFVACVPYELAHHGPEAILGGLAHEAAHMLAEVRHSLDTSRQGRYHNQVFYDLVGELGCTIKTVRDDGYLVLPVVSTPYVYGGKRSAVWFAHGGILKDLDEIFPRPAQHLTDMPIGRCRPQRVPRSDRRGRRVACACDPPREFGVPVGVLACGPITCSVCGENFIPKESA